MSDYKLSSVVISNFANINNVANKLILKNNFHQSFKKRRIKTESSKKNSQTLKKSKSNPFKLQPCGFHPSKTDITL